MNDDSRVRLSGRTCLAIVSAAWLLLGAVFVTHTLRIVSAPALDSLQKISGIINRIDEQVVHPACGPATYTLLVRLQGSKTRYVMGSGRLSGGDLYQRVERALRHGDAITLWAEQHETFGNRIWQIDRQGRRLLAYQEMFQHESSMQWVHYRWPLGYLVLTLILAPFVIWHWRVARPEPEYPVQA